MKILITGCAGFIGYSLTNYLLKNNNIIVYGIDNIDTSISSMSMTYGHSPTETLASIFEGKNQDFELNMELLEEIAEHFKVVREKYSEFEGTLKGVDSSMLLKQVPGGMLSNLESQLKTQKQEGKLEETRDRFDRIVKASWHSDLALRILFD